MRETETETETERQRQRDRDSICARLTPSGLGQQMTDIGLTPGAVLGTGVDAEPRRPRPRRVGRASRAGKGVVDGGRVE